jgi:hypothetical protein
MVNDEVSSIATTMPESTGFGTTTFIAQGAAE